MLGFLKLQGTTCGGVIQKVPTTYAQEAVDKQASIIVIINNIHLLKASVLYVKLHRERSYKHDSYPA